MALRGANAEEKQGYADDNFEDDEDDDAEAEVGVVELTVGWRHETAAARPPVQPPLPRYPSLADTAASLVTGLVRSARGASASLESLVTTDKGAAAAAATAERERAEWHWGVPLQFVVQHIVLRDIHCFAQARVGVYWLPGSWF